MNNKIVKAVASGFVGTLIMTLVMKMAPMMGLPKMDTAAMLSMMIGFPVVIGWLMHFMIGIIFAVGYYLFIEKLLDKVSNFYLKGAIFGVIVFIFAQISMAMMSMMATMPTMDGSMIANLIGSLIGHIVYGISVLFFNKIITK